MNDIKFDRIQNDLDKSLKEIAKEHITKCKRKLHGIVYKGERKRLNVEIKNWKRYL